MPIPSNVRKAIDDYKVKDPRLEGRSDSFIFNSIKGLDPSLKWDDAPKPKAAPKTDASYVNAFEEWFDYGIDEKSYDWMKSAYNNSLTGMTEELVKGKKRYNLEEYNPTILEDIGSMALSFWMPLDMIAMSAGGALGAGVRTKAGGTLFKGLSGHAMKGIEARAGAEFGKKAMHHVLPSAIRQASSLAVYEGSIGGVQAGIEGEDVMTGIGKGAFHGGILGAITGGIGGGMSFKHGELMKKFEDAGKIATKVGKEATSKLTKTDLAKKIGLGMPGQIGAEASVFSKVELAERALHGEDLRLEDVLVTYGRNIGLFGVLKGQGALMNRGKRHLKMLEKYEADKLNVDKDGRARESLLHEEAMKSQAEYIKELRKEGKHQEADNIQETLNQMIKERVSIDQEHTQNSEKFKEIELRIDELGKSEEPSVKRATDIIQTINELIGIEQSLIETGSKDASKIYESSIAEFKATQNELIRLAESWGTRAKRDVLSKEKLVDMNKEISPTTGESVDIYNLTDYKLKKDGSGKKADQLKFQNAIEKYSREKLKEAREKITPLSASEESINITSTEDFRNKNWSEQYSDKTLAKDISDNVKGKIDPRTKKREKGLADVDAEVASDTGNFAKNSKEAVFYENSKKVVRHFIQQILPAQLGASNRPGSLIGNAPARGRQLNNFAKFLAKNGKDFTKITNADVQLYLSQNPSHVTQMQPLVQFLKDGRISGGRFNITPPQITDAARKYTGVSPEGVTIDAHSIGNNTITYKQPKTNQLISKYISTPLQKLFNKLKGVVETVNLDSNQHFLTKDGKPLDNKFLNAFTDHIFGKKKRDYETIPLAKSKQKALKVGDTVQWTSQGVDQFQVPRKITKIMDGYALVEGTNTGLPLKELLKIEQSTIGGNKKIHSQARLFRRSIIGWAAERFGTTDARVELLTQEVLGDKAKSTVINKAYVSKEAQQLTARALVKEFLKEIKDGGIESKGKDFYSTKEIADGFKKLTDARDGKKDITLKIDGKEVTINALTAETMGRYLVETAPRLNEVVLSGNTKYQLESAASRLGITVKELKTQSKYFTNLYPELKIIMENSLGKYQGEYVLGRVTGHLIEIAKGKANADTIPHEVSHHVVDILRAFGDKRSKKLIRDGERMFKGEENMVQSIGEYVAGAMKNKGLIAKTKQWIQKFVSHLKNRLGIHNAQDVTRIMGEKVLKGELPKSSIDNVVTKFQTAKSSEAVRTELTNIQADIKARKLEQGVPLKIRNRERVEIFGKEKYDLYKDVRIEEIERYREFLEEYNLTNGNTTRVVPFKIQRINQKYHVTPEYSKEVLKLMNVKEGLYENASPETAKAYESFIRNQYDKPILQETVNDSILHKDMSKTFDGGFLNAARRAVMPVWLVLQQGGAAGKKISKLLLEHEYVEHTLYKGKMDEALHTVKGRLEKDVNNIHLFDKERADRNFKEGTLDKNQLIMYENLYGKNKDVNSNAYKAHQTWKDMTDWSWDQLKQQIRKHETPEGAEKAIAELDRIKVEGYMTRTLSKDAILYLTDRSSYVENLVKNNQEGVAKKRAKAEAKTSDERILLEEKYINDKSLKEEIRREVFDSLQFGYNNVKNPNLIERGTLLPEYADVTVPSTKRLKRIKVYENSLEVTGEAYVRRMSKYLATVNVFPEYTGIGSKYKMDRSKRLQVEALEKDSNLGAYASKAIKRQLGVDRSDTIGLAAPLYRAGGFLANSGAAMGLSSPLSGIKNLMIGIPRAIGDFGAINTLRGIKHVFESSAWHEARKKGALEYGSKSLELGGIKFGEKFSMAKLFQFNMMTKTENINRIISSHAGKLYFAEAQRVLRGERGMFKMGSNKKRMKRLMEELWHLDKTEIDFLEKTKDFSTKEAIEMHGNILNKVHHFSHVSAQGGTSTVLLPLWMSSKEAKPLTLFQRMAMSTTIDTYRNFVKPIAEFGNIMPLARAAVAHSVTGAALYAMFDELFGKKPPIGSKLSQDDGLEKVMMNLWRSEFFGLFGEILSPYEKELAVPISQPVIIRNLQESGNAFTSWWLGSKDLKQAAGDWARRTVVVGAQFERFTDTQRSKYYKEFTGLRQMTQKFKKEHKLNQYSSEGIINRRLPYYRNLKNALMFGSEEDIAKEYWKSFNFIVTDLESKPGGSSAGFRIKQARADLNRVIKHYDPLNISDTEKGTSNSLKKEFLNWLTPENKEMALKLEKQYQYKLRNYFNIIRKNKYRDLYTVYPNNKG